MGLDRGDEEMVDRELEMISHNATDTPMDIDEGEHPSGSDSPRARDDPSSSPDPIAGPLLDPASVPSASKARSPTATEDFKNLSIGNDIDASVLMGLRQADDDDDAKEAPIEATMPKGAGKPDHDILSSDRSVFDCSTSL